MIYIMDHNIAISTIRNDSGGLCRVCQFAQDNGSHSLLVGIVIYNRMVQLRIVQIA